MRKPKPETPRHARSQSYITSMDIVLGSLVYCFGPRYQIKKAPNRLSAEEVREEGDSGAEQLRDECEHRACRMFFVGLSVYARQP